MAKLVEKKLNETTGPAYRIGRKYGIQIFKELRKALDSYADSKFIDDESDEYFDLEITFQRDMLEGLFEEAFFPMDY